MTFQPEGNFFLFHVWGEKVCTGRRVKFDLKGYESHESLISGNALVSEVTTLKRFHFLNYRSV